MGKIEKKITPLTILIFCLSLIYLTGCRTTGSSDNIKKAKTFADEFAKAKEDKGAKKKPQEPPQKTDLTGQLSLTKIIDIALKNNPKTRQARQNALAALAQKEQAKSDYFPQANVSGKVDSSKTVSSQPNDDSTNTHYEPSLNLTYLLFDFGGRHASFKEAVELYQSTNLLYNQSVQDLILEVKKAFYGFYSAQSILGVTEADVNTAKQDLDAARLKLEAGVVTKLDVLQAESDYNSALYQLEQAKGELEKTRAVLAIAMGLPADTKFEIKEPSDETPTEMIEQDVSLLIKESLDRRPDLAASRATLRSKEAVIKAANSDLWPTLSLGGSGARNWNDYTGDIKYKEHNYNYTGYLKLSWDIFDGFYNLNKKRQAQAEHDAIAEKLSGSELQAGLDVWSKFYDFKTAASKLKYSKAVVDTTQTAYELSYESYKAGLKTILDLIQAQDQFSDAKNRLIQSKEDLFIALAELAHATGTLNITSQNQVAYKKEGDK